MRPDFPGSRTLLYYNPNSHRFWHDFLAVELPSDYANNDNYWIGIEEGRDIELGLEYDTLCLLSKKKIGEYSRIKQHAKS